MNIEQLLEALHLGESQDVEFKSAQGGLPKSLWETVSAFANTAGGTIILGIKEQDDGFEIQGIANPKPLAKIFWDIHNNVQKLSTPVCRESDLSTITIEGKTLLCIQIPRIPRRQCPVYINHNPLTGSFKRNYEGDYRCSQAEVKLMLREAGDEPLDGQILEGFTIDDLDTESLSAYRNRFASRVPDHPFLAKNGLDFLESLGGWRRDRRRKIEGITLAGLLMFGKERSILEQLPHFHLDYQEQLSSNPDDRWTDRITIDGTWIPNLFNFYYRIYPRLIEGISVPFKLDKTATRQDETPVHDAMREALVNTLIHADHQSVRPIQVLKRSNVFVFINPGRLRISPDQLYRGGVSDPRNPSLQKMFQMLGLGEKAGSGFQKILRAWQQQHWVIPLVLENLDLEMTAVRLPLVSMIPENIEKELRAVLGDTYTSLDEMSRMILLLATSLGEISNNTDIQQYLGHHPRDIGICLGQLVTAGCLYKDGHGRGTRYRLNKPDENSTKQPLITISISSEHLPPSSEHLPPSSEHLNFPNEGVTDLSNERKAQLLQIALPVRDVKKVAKTIMEETILTLCDKEWLTLRTLTELLNRHSDTLRTHYINAMLKDGRLEALVPGSRNHPGQAYRRRQP